MPKWANSTVLDGGPNYIKANCTSIRLISTYSAGDNYTTILANTLADVVVTTTDFTIAAGASSSRTVTSAAKTDSAANASGGGATNHVAFCATAASEVMFVTPESTQQPVTINNPVVIAPVVCTFYQPT